MTLYSLKWEKFKEYLILERNFKDGESSLNANKSRFLALKKWFDKRDFTRINFVSFVQSLQEEGKAAETLNKHISMARNIEKYLILNGLIEKKVLEDFMYRSVGAKPTKQVITPQEILQIVNCNFPYKKFGWFFNLRDRAMFMVCTFTGCRAGEIVKLKWTDIVDDGTRKFVVFRDTKSKKNREVVIPPAVWESLQKIPRWTEYIFCSYRRKQLRTGAVNQALKSRALLVGISKPISTHLLRHSLITQLLESGADWFGVSVIVGHADPRTTRGYLQKNKKIQEQALAKHPLNKSMLSYEDCIRNVLETVRNTNQDACTVNMRHEQGKVTIELIQVK